MTGLPSMAELEASCSAARILRGQALHQALLALDAHIDSSPSDVVAHSARDALELLVADSYPTAMPWPLNQALRERLAELQAERGVCA